MLKRFGNYVLLFLSLLWLTRPATAQSDDAEGFTTPEPIEDNSFMLEEAYNQEAGVVQHIFTYERDFDTRDWTLALEQEWPLWSQRHQFSYEIPLQATLDPALSKVTGIGDISLSYRYQLLGMEDHDVAFAPRASVIIPTGDPDKNLGNGGIGFELGLPLSVVLGESFVAHTNLVAGVTPNAAPPINEELADIHLGQSVIWLPFPKFNLLAEAVYSKAFYGGEDAGDSFIVNPGVRWAHDLDNGLQIVPGISVAVELGAESTSQIFIYLSLEHGF